MSKGHKDGGVTTLRSHIRNWSLEKVKQVLQYCRDWNTRSINSHVAMLVVHAIVTTVPPTELAVADGIPAILAGILPYAERHFDRLDRMCTNAYLLDYTLHNMGSMQLHDDNDDYYNDDDDDMMNDRVKADEQAKMENEFATTKSKLVLPPKHIDGRIQVGGSTLVGGRDVESDSDLASMGDSSDEE